METRQASPTGQPYFIGPWLVEPTLYRMTYRDTTVQIEPKVMQVLDCLASAPGQVFSRDVVLQTVWHDTVVGDIIVARAISELRKVLGDNPRSPAYIETIPKRGYRLIADVRPYTPTEAVLPDQPTARPAWQHHRRWAGFVLLLLPLLAWWRLQPGQPTSLLQQQPLTAFSGFEFNPALSPDGTKAAFIWTGGAPDGQLNVYVQALDASTPQPLTDTPFYEYSPTWSPDGRYVAFGRSIKGLFMVSAQGGPARKLTDIHPSTRPTLAWSPADRWLAFSDRDSVHHPTRLFLLDLQTLARTPLTTPPLHFAGDHHPAYSPDGTQLAFIRTHDRGSDLYVMPAKGGPATRWTQWHAPMDGLVWKNPTTLLFSAALAGRSQLWTLAHPNAKPQLVRPQQERMALREPTISLTSGKIAYTETIRQTNIWQHSLRADTTLGPLLPSTWQDLAPRLSPDGQKMAFISTRSGSPEVWVANPTGEALRQLSHFKGLPVADPAWSPDGQTLVFHATQAGQTDVFSVSIDGGPVQQLTNHPALDQKATWHPEGDRLLFASDRGGRWQLWTYHLAADSVSLSLADGYRGAYAPDGNSIFFVHHRTDGIWQLTTTEQQPKQIVEGFRWQNHWQWEVVPSGLVWADRSTKSLQLLNLTTQIHQPLGVLPNTFQWHEAAFSLAPDLETLWYTYRTHTHYDLKIASF